MSAWGAVFRDTAAGKSRSLERLLNRLVRRIVRRLSGDGLPVEDPEQPWLDLEPSDTLDHLNAAARTLTLKNPALARTDLTPKPFTVNQNGFSLNCSVACQAHQRDRLERLCRYITRPALCLERLSTREQQHTDPPTDSAGPLTAPLTWAQRLARVFEIDTTLCPLCGGQLRVIADITAPDLIRKILDHRNSRAPPRQPPRRAESHPNLPDLFAER
ncbi:MAG: transposase [Pseudomonadota bacterium]